MGYGNGGVGGSSRGNLYFSITIKLLLSFLTAKEVTSLEVYFRYQTTVENRIYKAIMMLKALKNK